MHATKSDTTHNKIKPTQNNIRSVEPLKFDARGAGGAQGRKAAEAKAGPPGAGADKACGPLLPRAGAHLAVR